jgi:hypothetical protein
MGVVIVLASGCGTGEYKRRMEKRITELRQVARFNALYAPAELEGTPILVRIPQVFKNPQLVVGTEVAEKPVDAKRAGISFLRFPDKGKAKTVVYEAFVPDSSGGQQPFYIYATAITDPDTQAALRGPSPDRMESAGDLAQTLEKAFPGKVRTWEDVGCPSPNGNNVPWQKIRAEGDQEFFYIDAQGKAQIQKFPGLIEIYARTEGDCLVLITWRMPSALEGSSNMAQLAQLVCGSLASRGSAAQSPRQ